MPINDTHVSRGDGKANEEEPIGLHDLLLRDWGTELPIRGGYGGSREDPIIITTSDAESVALTRVVALRGLGRGRGIFWRTLNHALLGDKWPGIEQFKIETVKLTDTQIVTQTENYYFDVSAMVAAHRRWQLPPVIVHRDVSGLIFPFEMGWLHFDNSENTELHAPGMGLGLHYKAPSIICSLYVYDRGRTDIPGDLTDDVIQKEFERAASDIATVRPNFAAYPDQPTRQDCLQRYYYSVADAGRETSLLLLTASRGRFVKTRMTWVRDPFIDRAATNSVDALLATTRTFAELRL
jgi:hypothetical protein